MTRRLSLLAGRGQLVREAADAALTDGWTLQVVDLVGRNDVGDLETVTTSPSNPLSIWMALRKFKPTHICMIGSVSLSDRDREGLVGFLRGKRSRHASQGDSAMSRLTGILEFATGASVVGIHNIVGGLLAPEQLIGGPVLSLEHMGLAKYAMNQARAIGSLDAGQAIVTSGKRVIAIEDIAGTDALIERVQRFRQDGLAGNGAHPLVLAKCRKPGQPDTVDLPAIGPETIRRAAEAGIGIIAVQSRQTLLIERETIAAHANAMAVSVVGIHAEDNTDH